MLNFDVNVVASDCFEKLESGELDGVDILLFAKKLEELSKLLKSSDTVKEDAIREISSYAKGEPCTRGGFKLTYYTTSKYSYDFEEYARLKNEIKSIAEDKIKPLEAMAKSLTAQGIQSAFFPNEDGEQIEIKAAKVEYSDVVKIENLK